mgnify:CR=1 FL=1
MSESYDFVDFLGQVKPFNEAGNLSGKLHLYIKPLTPIFIGAGYEDRDGDLLYKCFQRYNDMPVIPGSTLKGVLRTISEAVSYSCVEVSRDIERDLPFRNRSDCNCIVCKTYGRMGQKGCVNFGDFILKEGTTEKIKIPVLLGPHVENREVYYKNGKLRGIKFYRHGDYRKVENTRIPVEAVMPGSVFEGEIIFYKVHKKQLMLLCYSLGLDGSFQLKIGGNKSGFFGSCEVEVKESYYANGLQFDTVKFARSYGENDINIQKNKHRLSDILDYKSSIV